jgi:hypothetical protein
VLGDSLVPFLGRLVRILVVLLELVLFVLVVLGTVRLWYYCQLLFLCFQILLGLKIGAVE